MRLKLKEKCLHVKYAIEYEEYNKRMAVIGTCSSGNLIKVRLRHAVNDANQTKIV